MSNPKSRNTPQSNFLFADLIDQLNPKHPLLRLAKQINWSAFDDAFSPLYSHLGKPAKHIRLMVGLLILKHMENLSGDVLVQRWAQDPYYQAFTGEAEFQWKFPCNPTSLTKFRRRIENKGFEKILSVSIAMHREKVAEDEMCIDKRCTTAWKQEVERRRKPKPKKKTSLFLPMRSSTKKSIIIF